MLGDIKRVDTTAPYVKSKRTGPRQSAPTCRPRLRHVLVQSVVPTLAKPVSLAKIARSLLTLGKRTPPGIRVAVIRSGNVRIDEPLRRDPTCVIPGVFKGPSVAQVQVLNPAYRPRLQGDPVNTA